MQKFLGLGIGIILLCFTTNAQHVVNKDTTNSSLTDKAVGLVEGAIDLVTFEKGRHNLTIYPMAGYSPRQGLHIGVMPVWRIKPNEDISSDYYRPTTIAPSLKVSTSGMYEVELDFLGFTRNRWMFISKFQYLYLPDKYYGIGNQVKEPPFSHFDIHRFSLKSDVLKGINEKWFVGLRLDLNYNSFANISGELLTPDVVGYNGGWANGIGPGFAYDTRDNQLYPSSGWFVNCSSVIYGSFMGSAYDFTSTTLDVRKYVSLNKDKSILGFQAYVSGADGEVPFYKMSFLGGSRLLRGISHPYMYMDKHAWYAQSEWRKHIWWRLGGVVFAGVGKVSPEFMQAPLKDVHLVMGTGFRFRVLPDEGLNFRMDFGISNHGDSGVYFTIREAF